MGSWNMSCSLTGCSISPGDRAVVVLQQPGQFGDHKTLIFHPADYIHTSEGLLATVFLPIFGTYGDYGELEWTIEENPHLQHVVDEFDLDAFLRFDKEPEKSANEEKFPDGLFATWIHRHAWDQVQEHFKAEELSKETYWPNTTLLKALGFVEQGRIENEQRYSRKFVHPDWPNDLIGSDGNFAKWFEIEDGEIKQGPYICTYPDIVKLAKKKNLPLDRSVEADIDYHALDHMILETEKSYEFDWVEELETLSKQIADGEEVPTEVIEQVQRLAAKGRRSWSHHNWQFLARSRHNHHAFCNIWGELLTARDPDVMKIMVELRRISSFFYLTGRMMIPTQNGPQCGEPAYSKKLGEITVAIALKSETVEE